MNIESYDFNKLENLAQTGNGEALCELGVRSLGGLFGLDVDLTKAYDFFSKSNTKKAEFVLKKVRIDSESAISKMMLNLATWYKNEALDLEQSPIFDEQRDLLKNYAVYWYRSSMDQGNQSAEYGLAKFYYMLGGVDYELAAILYIDYWDKNGNFKDMALETLMKMYENGWVHKDWKCYADVEDLLISQRLIKEKTSELNCTDIVVDEVTFNSYMSVKPDYPGRIIVAEEVVKKTKVKLPLFKKLLNLGIPAIYKSPGCCLVEISRCPDLPDCLKEYDYKIYEGRKYYVVRDFGKGR